MWIYLTIVLHIVLLLSAFASNWGRTWVMADTLAGVEKQRISMECRFSFEEILISIQVFRIAFEFPS